ncbi:MAG TPA: transketolase, partial [Acidimicrobiales bacterium]|nr:transketolase [Acidimicrobiales bacterium]
GMALAPLAHVLWTRIMKYDASYIDWPDRDRFVLSNGHASILLYSMLCLTGIGDLTLEDVKQFRQWGSKTPGHPEVHHTKGVEVTTGPLGQGFANGVGMGIAERYLRSRFSPDACDHHTFVIAGDGCLEEGVSHEAGSLAGHLKLGRLVYIYDDNHITIDGDTALSYSDDAGKRFEAYGWHVENLGEAANDLNALESALRRAMADDDAPSMIILRSHIGYPSPKYTDTEFAHGNPLGADEIRVTKEILGLPPGESFYIPDDVLAYYREAGVRGRSVREEWEKRFASLDIDHEAWDACLEGRGLDGWQSKLPSWSVGEKVATRKSSGACLQALVDVVPGLMAGGADLTGNTGTVIKDHGVQSKTEPGGRQIYFGVREHGMGSVMNGMALHHGTLPVGGTFFVFSDYMRGGVRLAAISDAKVIYSWTHDSIGLGQDGPTHQPIEHLASLRAMPNLRLIRPADANECAVAWQVAVEAEKGATALILTRQDVPVVLTTEQAQGLRKGAYVVTESDGVDVAEDDLDLVLIGTGSELSVCLDAKPLLEADGLKVRVVSMPSWELFDVLDADEQEEVLPADVPTLAVEAASSFGWDRWADDSVSIDHFGASAPGNVVMEKFGYTAANVADRARQLLDELDEGD